MTKKELNKLYDEIGDQPTRKANSTPQELKEYAHKRAKLELATIDYLNSKDDPQADDEYREPLGITQTKLIKIELSWGGDADGFKIEMEDYEAISGVYYWADWGVYEEVQLTEKELDKIVSFYALDCLE